MEKAAFSGGFFIVPSLWGHASSGLTKAYNYEDSKMMAEGQPAFPYDDATFDIFDKYLSVERLAAYVNYARGDKWVAIRLYERNSEVSEALYGIIQALEICLRNAIHNTLAEHLGGPGWFETFCLQDSERRSFEDAKKNILDRPAVVTPGRIVAELTFAFWVRLFSAPYDKTLWVPYLRRLFPIKHQNSRKLVHGRLVELKTLRNRIAHHERLICGRQKVQQDYEDTLETIGWMHPTMKQWVESTNCCKERFGKPLPRKPRVPTVLALSLL